jgi:hypothetical protein
MRERLAADREPKRVGYHLEHTVYWDDLMRSAGAAEAPADGGQIMLTTNALLDELRLQGDRYGRVHEQALLRDLALAAARHQGERASADALQQTERRFLQAHGLSEPEARRRWLEENHLTDGGFEELIQEEALLDLVRSRRAVSWQLLDQLRINGEYRALRERARDKQRRLEAAGLQDVRPEDIGLSPEELLQWHFQRPPSPVEADLRQYARRLGYGQVDEFVRALLREHCYARLTSNNPARGAATSLAVSNNSKCLTAQGVGREGPITLGDTPK